jgi:WD40 repeat protein
MVTFSRDCKTLLSEANDGIVVLWDARSGAMLKMVKEKTYSSGIRATFSPDGNTLVASDSRTVTLWDNQSLLPKKLKVTVLDWEENDFSNFNSTMVFSPDCKTLASVWKDRTVTLWDTRSGAVRITLPFNLSLSTSVGPCKTVVFSPDGKILAASFGKVVVMWDSRSWAVLKTLEGHSKRILDMVFSPDSKALATASEDGRVRLWSNFTSHRPSP